MRRSQLLLALALTLLASTAGLAVERQALANGLRVLVTSDLNSGVMTAEVLLPISVAEEGEEQQGIRYLTQRMLLRGAATETGDAMAQKLAEVGGVVGVNVGLDYVELYVQSPTDGFEVALGLLAEAVRSPAFRQEELEKEREWALKAIRVAAEDPFQRTYQAFREELYGEGPYGRWTQGLAHCVERLTREDLVAFHRKYYRPGNAVLSIAGGIEVGRALRAAQKEFGDWASGATVELGIATRAKAVTLERSGVVARELPVRQTHLVLGFPAPAVGEPGYYAMQVIDSLLGGGSTARLPRALREEAGLVYQVSSFYPTLKGASHFGIYAVVEQGSAAEAKATILRELERLRQTPPSAEELSRAKRYLLGSHALSRQTSQMQAYSAAWYELLGLPPSFPQEYQQGVNGVTALQVQEAARELIHHFVLALTMPSE